jgi:predicted dehydrogenase
VAVKIGAVGGSVSLRIGLVGAGLAGSHHASAWAQLTDRARVVAVAEASADAAARAASGLGARTYASLEDLLGAEEVEAVDICVPPHLHADLVGRAAEAGVHILCEKPMATSLEDAHRIAEAVRSAGVVYLAGHNTLFLPTIQRAHALIERGELGPLYLIRSMDCFEGSWTVPARLALDEYDLPAFFAPGAWRTQRDLLRGGALTDGGVHAIYRLLHLAGSPPAAVWASTRRVRDDLPLEGEDSALVLIEFVDGVLGEVIVSYAFGPPTTGSDTLFVALGREGQLGGDEVELTFRPGGWDTPARRRLSDLEGREAIWHATLVSELAHFLDCITLGHEPVAGLREAMTALAVVKAAYRSAHEGVRVELDLATTSD